MFPLNKGLYERFQKNGLEYECVISPISEQSKQVECHVQFQVILKTPRQADFIRFLLSSTRDGHWAPDEKKLVDPWMADAIGKIIVENF